MCIAYLKSAAILIDREIGTSRLLAVRQTQIALPHPRTLLVK